ncbi:MAG TPA: Clp protease N-terminal domain-containing protein [Trebonia sp.]
MLRWLRARLSWHGGTSLPFRPEIHGAELAARGTPAAEATLQQAARLAGPLPVGSHHLLLAALEDPDSAASATLASVGVDLDDLRSRLRAAPLAGTSDEQPEQAGRRQMALQVSDEMLTVVLTDPLIVESARLARRAVNPAAAPGPENEVPGSSAAYVIRGDHPAAANLAQVWLELRKTLNTLATVTGDTPQGKTAQAAAAEPGDEGTG